MKLFQRLLLVPATLGFLTPFSASANEVNLNEISNYSDVEDIEIVNAFDNKIPAKSFLLAGGEGLVQDQDTDSFSETTTASFSADFGVGATDGVSGSEAVQAVYGFQIDLTTSFTGEDSLDISIDAGNGGNGLSELDLNEGASTDDVLAVDGISYTFPVGEKATVFVGDNMDGSTLYSTACVYGGPTNNLDDCGNGSSAMAGGAGTAAGASFDIGNGFTAAIGYTGDGTSSNGLLTKEGMDTYGGQLSYAADSYGLSVTYANVESADDTTFWGLNGYWTPDSTGSVPSISVGYEMGDPTTAKDTTQYFVGLQWDEVGPGSFGAALGTIGATTDGDTELLMYEAFYSYPVNDGMTITPVVYVQETAAGSDDITGVMVKTSFSF